MSIEQFLCVAKVCFRLKQQLTALEALHSAMQKENWPPIAIRPEVIDVRVAQHILMPDSGSVADSPEIEELRRKVDPDVRAHLLDLGYHDVYTTLSKSSCMLGCILPCFPKVEQTGLPRSSDPTHW